MRRLGPSPDTRPISRRALRVAVTVLAVAFGVAGAAVVDAGASGAQADEKKVQKDRRFRDFWQTGEFVVVVDGKVRPSGEVWSRPRAMLIRSDVLDRPLLIRGSSRRKIVQAIDESAIHDEDAGSAFLERNFKADTCCTPQNDRKTGGWIFEFEGKSVLVRANTYMLGRVDLDELLEHSPQYGVKSRRVDLDDDAVAALKKMKRVTLRVYFGSWCPRCATLLPKIVALEKAVGCDKLKVEYVGLKSANAEKGKWELAADEHKAHDMPTGVLLKGDKVLGRIIGNDFDRPAAALLRARGDS